MDIGKIMVGLKGWDWEKFREGKVSDYWLPKV